MPPLTDAADKVPMMFRAQVNGRCQLQRLIPKADEQDAERWADEWIDKTYPDAPEFGEAVQTRTYQLSWRFVTNGGQDDGVIRPVIGAKGWPFYPGSSMKGVFRQACDAKQAGRYCGKATRDDFIPGILRFHGGYPTDDAWTEDLVDIVHPQQERQVKQEGRSSAFIQMSLYQPELKFGISSTIALPEKEWATIWQIWEKAIASGLGCRVSAGYGQPQEQSGDVIYYTQLKGQGQAAKLINGEGEFRPNIFRAAIRGHAMRIFGGLTDEDKTEKLVQQLFGGVRGGATVGLLSMSFQADEEKTELGWFGKGKFAQPTYEMEGKLLWMLTRSLSDDERTALTQLIEALTRFAMVLGGFGKSWRRADHRLVYPDYYSDNYKALIGCHWQWVGKRAEGRSTNSLRKLEHLPEFISKVQAAAKKWMQLQGVKPNPTRHADWREAWHPDKVQVWGRLTKAGEEMEDSYAVHWLHGPYRQAIPTANIREGSIYKSSLTGQMGQIGRLWHRMYPYIRLVKDPQNPPKPMPLVTNQYFELLTLFPDNTPQTLAFLDYLETQQKAFQKLWPR
ncbi:MAG: RAMP superfamily protein [Cyanobacteria bacterium P01_F01_bin.56]